MASFPERNLNQTAVYWGSPTKNNYGEYTYADPVEIKCRWVDKIQTIKDAKGKEETSIATVQVKQDLDYNGMLFLGTLCDLDSSDEANPATADNAYLIKRFDKTPTLKGNKFFRRAYL